MENDETEPGRDEEAGEVAPDEAGESGTAASGGDPEEFDGVLDEALEGALEEVSVESEELAEEIREELVELERLRDRHLRLAAEFENYRKRTRREKREAGELARGGLVERLLDPLDDLNRVLEASEEGDVTLESLREGLELAHRKLEKELSEAGLSRMEPEGERFDPELHDALLSTPTDDPDEDKLVSRVLISGYRFGDRVLRPARVEVKRYSGGGPGGGSGELGGRAAADGEDGTEGPDGDGGDGPDETSEG